MAFEARIASLTDLEEIVALHQIAFAEFFLTRLGSAFLRRMYRALLVAPGAICLISRYDGALLGFAVGPLEPQGFFRGLLLRQGLGFLVDAIPALLRNPLLIARRLARAISYRGEVPRRYTHAALLSSIAVHPTARGSGAAPVLLDAFCREARRRGAQHVYLTTDRDDNLGPHRFYEKHGFAIEAEIARRDGRVMYRYIRDLRATTDAAYGIGRRGGNDAQG